MEDSRKIKSVMLGIMDGKGRRGRPNMEWIDNIKEWCNKDLYSLITSALYRKFWKQTIKLALDTVRHTSPKETDPFSLRAFQQPTDLESIVPVEAS